MKLSEAPRAIIIAGAPASGKPSLASLFVEDGYYELNRDHIRFHGLKLGTSWVDYEFSRENEGAVQRVWQREFEEFSLEGKNFVISDTLCSKGDRTRLANKLTKLGYEVIVVVLNPTLDVLLERDAKRGDFSVGEKVIVDKYRSLNA